MVEPISPARVLHIVSTMDRGGAETLLMNVYKNIDRTKIQFDFISHGKGIDDYEQEIKSLGGSVYKIGSLGELGPVNYLLELTKLMKQKNYTAVHAHTDFQSGFPVLAAKLVGIKKRICHSHSNNWIKGNSFQDKILFKVLQGLIKYSATNFCACSEEAAHFLFGKKAVENGMISILKNGIDVRQFITEDDNTINQLRKEFNLPSEAKVIGHIGRFSESKNHHFLLKLLKNLLNEDPNYYLVMVGNGPLQAKIEEEALKLGLNNNVRFVGVRSDIPNLMKLFDVFVFPSLFEGFGIVTLEAQCAGTPCVVSNTVPRTTDMGLNLISYIGLEENLDKWSKEISKAMVIEIPDRNHIQNNLTQFGFNIRESVNNWTSLYGIA